MRDLLERGRRDLYALAALFLLATLPLIDLIAGFHSLFIRDLTRFYYPTKRVIREVILSGSFPYWNPYYSAGQPMAANPEYEIFYPPQWLILLPDYDLGYRLHIWVHVYIGLAGMYLLLRSMRLQIAAAMFGALSFALGGFYLSLVNLLPILFAVAWIPLILLFARRFFLARRARDFALAAIGLGIQALAGEPTSMLQTWFLIGCYGLYRAWSAPGRAREIARRTIVNSLLAVAMVAAGLAIGAAQFIPALDHVGDSARSRPFEYSLVTAWSMPYARPLELVYPQVFGHIYRNGTWYWGSGLYPKMGSPFIFSIYGGLLATAMVVAGIAVRPKGSRFVLALAAFSMLIALGDHTPLFRFLYDAGLIRSIRYPEKFALIGMLALVIFAAKMFDRLVDGDRTALEAALGFTAAVTVVAAAISIVTFTDLYPGWFKSIWGITSKNPIYLLKLSREGWYVATARGALLFALLLWLKFRPAPSRAWHAAWVVFLFADLVPVTAEVIPRMPRSFFTRPPAAETIKGDPRQFRIFHEPDWYGSSKIARQYFSTAGDVYWVVRNGLYPMTTATWGFRTVLERDYDKTALVTTIDLVESMFKVRDRGQQAWADIFMAMSNAHYRAAYRPFEEERKRTGGEFEKSAPIRFELEARNPRYYFADQIVTIRGRDDFVEKLAKGTFSRRVAFVSAPAFRPARGRILRATESANAVRLEVESDGPSFLVLSVTPHKYWSATLDGKPHPLVVTNIGYQGMTVPGGRHVVAIRYRNGLVDLSLAITLASLLVSTVVAIRRPRNEPAEPPADREDVEEHPARIADDADAGVGGVDPADGDLGDAKPEP